jgi:16S rRNA (adenine1518-N6/adenine1519-N6)-dimethyltransferase
MNQNTQLPKKDITLPKANKKLGQHFLIDPLIKEKITNDTHMPWIKSKEPFLKSPICIEVGPGPGILSPFLVQKYSSQYYCIEKDVRFLEQLQKCVPVENILLEDILQFSWNNFLTKWKIKTPNVDDTPQIYLISNLPYNIAAPCMIQWVQLPFIRYMTLMMQKEMALKIWLEGSGKKTGIYFLLNAYFDIFKLTHVSPKAFLPPPKVQSTVLSFLRRDHPLVPDHQFLEFEKFLRKIFSSRRKQLQRQLKDHQLQEHLEAFEKLHLPFNIRAEDLEMPQLLALFFKHSTL